MKNVKRVYNATRDQWVKIVCKDEPKLVGILEKMFADMVRGLPPTKEPEKDQDRGR